MGKFNDETPSGTRRPHLTPCLEPIEATNGVKGPDAKVRSR